MAAPAACWWQSPFETGFKTGLHASHNGTNPDVTPKVGDNAPWYVTKAASRTVMVPSARGIQKLRRISASSTPSLPVAMVGRATSTTVSSSLAALTSSVAASRSPPRMEIAEPSSRNGRENASGFEHGGVQKILRESSCPHLPRIRKNDPWQPDLKWNPRVHHVNNKEMLARLPHLVLS